MGVSTQNTVTLRGHPSLYHADFTRILQMCTQDCMQYLKGIAADNPCIELNEGCNSYLIENGQPMPLREDESLSPHSQEMHCPLLVNDVSQKERPDLYGICDDFADSLSVYLSVQLPSFEDEIKSRICRTIIDFIDDRGLLREDPGVLAEMIGVEDEEIIEVLELVKSIDPGGIGSRDLKDFLWFQCRRRGWNTKTMKTAIYQYLENIAEGDMNELQRGLVLSKKSLQKLIERVRSLRPYPAWGMDFTTSPYKPREQFVQPDLVYYRLDNGDSVLLVMQPTLRADLLNLHGDNSSNKSGTLGEDNHGWSEKLEGLEREAVTITGLVDKRNHTVARVASIILDRQKAYVDGRRAYKEIQTVTQLARELNISVSTVSRAVKDKILATPRGTMLLKELFSPPFPGVNGSNISQHYVLTRIGSLIRKSEEKPRSDKEISEILKSEGIDIARRTVNKYRRSIMKAANSRHCCAKKG